MTNWLMRCGVLVLAIASLLGTEAAAQKPENESGTTLATGTLNVILANKNGFIIAADSRMSSEKPIPCNEKAQLYCDNSQKLFRTSPYSAIAIAGFAVGRRVGGSPLDLAVASALRKKFGINGFPTDQYAEDTLNGVDIILSEPLIGVAAIHDPSTPATDLSLTVTLARLDSQGVPVLQQLQFVETWIPMGPLNIMAPRYTAKFSQKVPITKFVPVAVGIQFVADGILQGVYKSDDPAIQNYYRKLKSNLLDDMPLSEMRALALAILRETERLTDYVGGGDQVGEFPANGEISFHLPGTLLTDQQLTARLIRWEGLTCTKSAVPPCGNPPMSFTVDSSHPLNEQFTKFLLASEFKDIPVSLDNNIFIADNFEGVTLKWYGGHFFSYRNTFKNCVLELTPDAQLSLYPELATCRVERKKIINLAPGTVGLHQQGQDPPGLLTLPRGFGP